MPTSDHSSPDEASLERERWLNEAEERAYRPYRELHLSSQGLLLQYDARRAFVAAAWASVIVICQAAIEATLRDLQLHDYVSKAKAIFFDQEDLERMRLFRNELLHPLPPGSASLVWSVPNGDYKACHAALEDHAKQAYTLMLEATFANRLR